MEWIYCIQCVSERYDTEGFCFGTCARLCKESSENICRIKTIKENIGTCSSIFARQPCSGNASWWLWCITCHRDSSLRNTNASICEKCSTIYVLVNFYQVKKKRQRGREEDMTVWSLFILLKQGWLHSLWRIGQAGYVHFRTLLGKCGNCESKDEGSWLFEWDRGEC